MSAIGQHLVDLRKRAGLSQEDLALKAGVGVRTVQRIERNPGYQPKPTVVKALAAAIQIDAARLHHGYSDEQLIQIADDFVCEHCGARLAVRHFELGEYGDSEYEEFECGRTRGVSSRPCPKDPTFPSFEEYDVKCFEGEDGWWYCVALGTTKAASSVALEGGRARTQVDARRLVRRSYIEHHRGQDAASDYMSLEVQVQLMSDAREL